MKYLTLVLIGIVILLGSYPVHSQIKTIKVEWIYNQNFINQEQAQLLYLSGLKAGITVAGGTQQ